MPEAVKPRHFVRVLALRHDPLDGDWFVTLRVYGADTNVDLELDLEVDEVPYYKRKLGKSLWVQAIGR